MSPIILNKSLHSALLVLVLVAGARAAATKEVGGGEANQLNLVRLEQPDTFALEFKKRFEFAKKENGDDGVSYSSILNVDALAGYQYHAKLHANADLGVKFTGSHFTRKQPDPFSPTGVGTVYYPTDFSLSGGLESAPAKPATGDRVEWETSNVKGALTLKQRIPHSDRPGLALGKILGSKTVAGAANLNVEAAFLDDKSKAPTAESGFRGRAGVTYAIPFFYDSEIFAQYEYAWGATLPAAKQFYMVQFSRYLTGSLAENVKAFVGGNAEPRFFARYVDGGTAPTYSKSRGWEFGLGTSLF